MDKSFAWLGIFIFFPVQKKIKIKPGMNETKRQFNAAAAAAAWIDNDDIGTQTNKQTNKPALYLQYAPCLKDISISTQKCSTVVRRFQSISKMMSDNEQQQQQQTRQKTSNDGDNDERLLRFCCAYQESVDCQIRNVRKYCGQEGLRFFEHYMSEMTNSLINQHCAGYTYSDKCKRLRRPSNHHNHNHHHGSLDRHRNRPSSSSSSSSIMDNNKQKSNLLNRKFIYFNNSTLNRHHHHDHHDQHQHNHNTNIQDDDNDDFIDNYDDDDNDDEIDDNDMNLNNQNNHNSVASQHS
ncbi:hypothetical protein DERF_010032, partial [Dermatophagoides farinae]